MRSYNAKVCEKLCSNLMLSDMCLLDLLHMLKEFHFPKAIYKILTNVLNGDICKCPARTVSANFLSLILNCW